MSTSTTETNHITNSNSIVILGGGIIGLSTAYYLSQSLTPFPSPSPSSASSPSPSPSLPSPPPPPQISILDTAPSLLLSASGYAGGFLAEDWFSPSLADLGALSFRLHQELAASNNGVKKWGYSRSTAWSLSVDEVGVGGKSSKKRKRTWRAPGEEEKEGNVGWLSDGTSRTGVAGGVYKENNVGSKQQQQQEGNEMLNDDGTPIWMTQQASGTIEPIGPEGSCAQVEPRELCEWLIEQVGNRGVQIRLSTSATGVLQDEKGRVKGVEVTPRTFAPSPAATASMNTITTEDPTTTTIIPCSSLILTAGAWTTRLFKTLFPTSPLRLGITPLAGYSVVVRSPRYLPLPDTTTDTTTSPTSSSLAQVPKCHSLFSGPHPTHHPTFSPELISRIPKSGLPEIYVAGLNDPSVKVPDDLTCVAGMMDEKKVRELMDVTVRMLGRMAVAKMGDDVHGDVNGMGEAENDLEVVRTGLCLRPVRKSGRGPVIAKLTGEELGLGKLKGCGGEEAEGGEGRGGVYVAAGHGPWGISLSLGTGLVVSEMVLGRKRLSADVSELGV